MQKLLLLLFFTFPIFAFAQKTIFIGSGYTFDIDNIYKLDGENIDAFQFRQKNSSFCFEGRINQKLYKKIGFSTGIKIGRIANYWYFNDFVVPELNGSYMEWWYSGYELGIPVYLNHDLDFEKIGKIQIEIGTMLGLRSLVTIKKHSHINVINPDLNLVALLVGSNDNFYYRFSGTYSLGINWQLPKIHQFNLNNFVVAFNYHRAFTRKQEFDIFAKEENITAGFEKNYAWKGYTKYQRFELKLYYILFKNNVKTINKN